MLGSSMTFDECKETGQHLVSCDDDGFCNNCGFQEPADYETCGECGFDHDYEYGSASRWHEANPCTYCVYNYTTHTHHEQCPTLKRANITRLEVHQCEGCKKNILKKFTFCRTCMTKRE